MAGYRCAHLFLTVLGLVGTVYTFPYDLNNTAPSEGGQGTENGRLHQQSKNLEILKKIHYHYDGNMTDPNHLPDDEDDPFLSFRGRIARNPRIRQRYGDRFLDKLDRFRERWYGAIALDGRSMFGSPIKPTGAQRDYFDKMRSFGRRRPNNSNINNGNRNSGNQRNNRRDRDNYRSEQEREEQRRRRQEERRRRQEEGRNRGKGKGWSWGRSKRNVSPAEMTADDMKVRTKRQADRLVRREIRAMTDSQVNSFFNALRSMANTMAVGGISEYELFVQFHQRESSPAAHFGAAFPVWHREFLFRMELALNQHGYNGGLPYWDSRIDSRTVSASGNRVRASDTVMWSNSLMGNSNGQVNQGPFSGWRVLQRCQTSGSTLTRGATQDGSEDQGLYQDSDIQDFLRATSYAQFSTSNEAGQPSTFEVRHGGPHVWVGGHMEDIICSPSDPVFWLHHGMVDLCLHRFRAESQTTPKWEYPTTNVGGTEHERYSPMQPFRLDFGGTMFDMFNQDGLDEFYESAYSYQLVPETCSRDGDCGGNRLLCYRNQCISRIRRGGRCSGLTNNNVNPCESGSFCNGSTCQ